MRRLQILYVENHADFAQVVSRSFLAAHAVSVVPSLAQARERLRAGPWDVLLVDYDLDDGKGAELVRELRRAGHPGPIVAASSHDEGNQALLRAGADVVCGKLQFAGIGAVLAELGLDEAGPPDCREPDDAPVLPSEAVLAQADDLLCAARNFRRLATALAHRLAGVLRVSPRSLSSRGFRLREGVPSTGEVNRLWSFRFHGFEVRFTSVRGLPLDVVLGYPEEFGVLDPDFFQRFVAGPFEAVEVAGVVRDDPAAVEAFLRGATVHARVAEFLRDDFHRSRRCLDVLAAAGRLEQAVDESGQPGRWFAPG